MGTFFDAALAVTRKIHPDQLYDLLIRLAEQADTGGGGFLQGGNAFGANAVLGTTDNFPLTFITNNTEKARLTSVATPGVAAGALGVGTTTPHALLYSAGTLGLETQTIPDLPAGGPIGVANATVDVHSSFLIQQTTNAGQVITLPNPTDTTAGRVVFVTNTGTKSFVMYSQTVGPTQMIPLVWTGSAWAPSGVGTATAGYTQGGNAFGATGVLGTTDAFDQTFISGTQRVLELGRIGGSPDTRVRLLAGIAGAAPVIQVAGTAANLGLIVQAKGSGGVLVQPIADSASAFGVDLAAGGAPRVLQVDTLNSSGGAQGRVGVGIDAPTQSLDVRGTALFQANPGNDSTTLFQILKSNGSTGVVVDTASGPFPARVGINTAPAKELDVLGTIQASSQVIALGSLITTDIRDPNNNTWLGASATPAAINYVRITNAATGSGPVLEAVGGDVNINLTIKPRGSGLLLFQPGADSTNAVEIAQAGGTIFFRADSTNQRVGIGAATPPAFPLDVTGVGRFTTAVRSSSYQDNTNGVTFLTATTAGTDNNNFVMTTSTGNAAIGLSAAGAGANVGITYLSKGTGIHLFKPGTDSTTAFQVAQAGGSVIFSVDSTNQRVGILQTTPLFPLDVTGVGRFTTAVRTPQLNDTASLAWLTSTATASAVNNLNVANAATGNRPTLSAVGTDANVGIAYVTKGTGAHVFKPGTDSTDAQEIQNAAGTAYVRYDSTNQRVGFGASTAPGFTVDATGIVHASSNLKVKDVIRNINPSVHTTTSSSYATIETSAAITFSGRPCIFQLSIAGRDNNSGVNEFFNMQFAIRVDAGADNTIAFIEGNLDGDHRVGSGYVIVTPSAGSHTIDLRWKRVAGAGTMTVDSNDYYLLSVIDLD
jgi:hypothetical protein